MKKTFVLCALVSSMMLTSVFATTNNDFQSATVVSVEQGATSAAADNSSSDAPLRDASYSYAIGIKLGDVIYQTAYQSAFADVVPVFAANQSVEATRKGSVIYVTLPGNRTVPMAIEGSTSAKGSSFSN